MTHKVESDLPTYPIGKVFFGIGLVKIMPMHVDTFYKHGGIPKWAYINPL
jgi:hypothetical protein